jgi:ribonuclease P protein component
VLDGQFCLPAALKAVPACLHNLIKQAVAKNITPTIGDVRLGILCLKVIHMGALKQQRLCGQSAYTALLKAKPVANNRCFVLHATMQSAKVPASPAKLGLVIGKRFAPHAHVRNRIKRLWRAHLTSHALPGAQIVVRLRSPVGQSAYSAAFAAQIAQLWHTARSILLAR